MDALESGPVLVLTRREVLDVRALVTVAEITASTRGLAAEVPIDHTEAGLDRGSAVNCDVCAALSYALDC